MKFDSLNTFYVNVDTDGDKIPVHFKRIGTKWKVVEIGFKLNYESKVHKRDAEKSTRLQ